MFWEVGILPDLGARSCYQVSFLPLKAGAADLNFQSCCFFSPCSCCSGLLFLSVSRCYSPCSSLHSSLLTWSLTCELCSTAGSETSLPVTFAVLHWNIGLCVLTVTGYIEQRLSGASSDHFFLLPQAPFYISKSSSTGATTPPYVHIEDEHLVLSLKHNFSPAKLAVLNNFVCRGSTPLSWCIKKAMNVVFLDLF